MTFSSLTFVVSVAYSAINTTELFLKTLLKRSVRPTQFRGKRWDVVNLN